MWRGELRHQLLQKTSDSQLFDKNKLFYELLAGCEITLDVLAVPVPWIYNLHNYSYHVK